MLWLLFLPLVLALELGSYKNPHPRPYDRCEANDLIKLSTCCNDVLARLDDCKANDLACECCALQRMDISCYNLCPGNPSTNFLAVLLNDCASLNDVNACNLPFKKLDGLNAVNHRAPVQDQESSVVAVKSKILSLRTPEVGVLLYNADDEAQGDPPIPQKPRLKLVNAGNATGMFEVPPPVLY